MSAPLLIGLNARYTHTNLAIRYLSQAAGCPFYESHINQNPAVVLEQLLDFDAPIYAFSCYIWNITYVLRLCRDLKAVKPDRAILLGGPEVSFSPVELLNGHPEIDFIFCGEGEEGIPKLFSAIISGSKSYPPGVVYREGKSVQSDPAYQLIADLDRLPYPYTDYPKNQIVYYEASRGCPFSCTYCQSGAMPGGVRYLSLDRVRRDIYKLVSSGVPLVKFVDRTFNADPERAKQLLSYLIDHTGNTRFHLEISADLLDNDCLALLRQSPPGKFQIEAGVQSCNPKTLSAVRRRQSLPKLLENVSTLLSFGHIPVHLDLIAGLPYEDFQSFAHSFNVCYALRPSMLQLGFLKVLPGSPMGSQPGIVHRSDPPYEVLMTDWLSAKELFILHGVAALLDRYANSGRFPRALSYLEALFPDPFSFFLALHRYAKAHGLTGRPLGAAAQFDLLADFMKTRENANPPLFLSLLKADYYEQGAKGNLPACFREIQLPFDAKSCKKAYPFAHKLDLLPYHPDTQAKETTLVLIGEFVSFQPFS